MAQNPYVNKVKYGNETLIDLTGDTVSPSNLARGETAHDKSGASIVGTANLEAKPYFDGNKVVFPSSMYRFNGTKIVYDGITANGGTIVF